MIQGASRSATVAAAAELDRVLAAPGTDADSVATELDAVSSLLDRELTLRRTLADPSRDAASRADLVERLFGSQVSAPARQVVQTAVRQRWSRPSHLAGALGDLAVQAVVVSAEQAGQLDDLEDELFRFRRIVEAEPALRAVLADQRVSSQRKGELLDSLLGDRVTPQTRALLAQAARNQSSRSIEHALEHYSTVAADRRARVVAQVRTATDLTEDQRIRLRVVLARIYGRAVVLDVQVDPTVLGGVSVRVGDEIVDATVISRLDEARRRVSG